MGVAISYRMERITPAERVELGRLGVLFGGQYGLITARAREHGVSRQFLYRRRAGRTPLESAGLPSPRWLDALGYGPPPPEPANFRPDRTGTVTPDAA